MPTTAYAITVTPPEQFGWYRPVQLRFEHAAAPAAEPNPNPAYAVRDGSTSIEGRVTVSDVTTFYFVAATAVKVTAWTDGDDVSISSVTPAAYATPATLTVSPSGSGTPGPSLSSRLLPAAEGTVGQVPTVTDDDPYTIGWGTGGGSGDGMVYFGVACSDETTALTTGAAKVTFRMPFAMTVSSVRANLATASSSGLVTVDINTDGVTMLTTKLSIDANERTSTTAATAAVISVDDLTDDSEMTIDLDAAGTNAKGLKVWLIGQRVIA
jgi:hypothetical protein